MTSLIHIPLSIADAEPAAHLPWARWAMKGAYFKLLSANLETDRFTLLIRIEGNVEAPRHRHIGAVEGMVLAGEFHYHDHPEESFKAGSYLFEPAGSVHQPVSAEGALMIGMFHGPIEGLDSEGRVTGRIGCAWHIRAWEAAIGAQPG